MAEWRIASTTDPGLTGVTDGSMPGEYIFQPPKNIAKNIYTIYYIDGDISGETEYIVSSADCYVDKCATNFFPPPVCFNPKQDNKCSEMTVDYKEGQVNTIYVLDDCWKLIGTNKTNNVTNVIVNNDGTSKIAYSANNSRGNIESVVTYKFKNETANITGESFVTIIQEPNKCYLEDCSSSNVPALSKNPTTKVPSTGGNVIISYTETDCWKYEKSEIIAGHASIANNVVTIAENESSTSDLTITAKYTFKNRASDIECYPTIDIIQEGVDPCKIDHECPTVQEPYSYDVSADGDTITVRYNPEKNNCWTLAVTSGGDTSQIDSIVTGTSSTSITIKKNTEGSSKTMTVTFTFTNSTNGEHCDRTITITQNPGCACDCNNVVKILTEENEPFYTYTTTEDSTHSLTNVPFAILTSERGATCEIITNKASDAESQTGITFIDCIKYSSSDTKWREKLKNKCNTIESSQNKDVHIIYGNLSESNHSRALGFTYTVCDNECKDYDGSKYIPYYVFQRCACGMDNCRNEYGEIIEDRPLFFMEKDCGWLQSDSICVETLSCITAYYYTREFENNQDIINDTPSRISNKIQVYNGGTVELRSGGTISESLNSSYVQSVSIRRSFNPVYSLHLHETGEGENKKLMLALCTSYNNPIQPYLPLGTSVEYICLADNLTNIEQVWEITFATSSNSIIGGDDNGKCALNQFTITLYKAPKGWDYDKDNIDRNNKRIKKLCQNVNCGCSE